MQDSAMLTFQQNEEISKQIYDYSLTPNSPNLATKRLNDTKFGLKDLSIKLNHFNKRGIPCLLFSVSEAIIVHLSLAWLLKVYEADMSM